ncbi:hypothetical protein ZEAMMB73_Zm00001d013591 [Zea mays]|uniref:Uncharacterized protein n=1 Tax=Zea mays TaxID=4577 RepID=A0A1D6GKQ3_MAIZE|nr:hypothetical protein ZEAMMB73_Zm00001d013591 [Zea mays]
MDLHVAIKRVSKRSKQGRKEYASEVRIISRLRHRNLVQLIGWCHGDSKLLLIYELMPNGSLDKHLYSSSDVGLLPWPVRHEIVLGPRLGRNDEALNLALLYKIRTRGTGCGGGRGGLGTGSGVTVALRGLGGAGGLLLLVLPALGGGHPGGLDMGGAVEAPALAAGAAAHVDAVLLGLVAAVLAADGARAGAASGAPAAARGARGGVIGEADDVGGVEVVVVLLRRVRRP